eukprot:195689_1
MQPLILLLVAYITLITTTVAYFKSPTDTLTFDNAKAYCENQSPPTTLATIKSPNDYQQAQLTVADHSADDEPWIGYVRNSGGDWTALDSSNIGDNLGFNDNTSPFDDSNLGWPWSGPPNTDITYPVYMVASTGLYDTADDSLSDKAMCNSCTANSCVGQGKCIEIVNDFKCACEEVQCLNGGTCIDSEVDNEDFVCKCLKGFIGMYCQFILHDECPTPNPTTTPSKLPTKIPTQTPSTIPTTIPSTIPTTMPTTMPTTTPITTHILSDSSSSELGLSAHGESNYIANNDVKDESKYIIYMTDNGFVLMIIVGICLLTGITGFCV